MDASILSPSPSYAVLGVAVQLVFPSLALGLACYLAVLEGLWLVTRNPTFRTLYAFWVHIFAVCFALGVVVMLALGRALGWGWSASELATIVVALGGLLAAMTFGRGRIGAPTHVLATGLMAAALLALLAWIVGLDAAAHAPAPMLYQRTAQLALGAFLSTALTVGAVSAWRLLREPDETASAMALRMSVGMLAICAMLRLLIGELPWTSPLAALIGGPKALTLQIEALLGVSLLWLALWAGWLERRRGGPERSRVFLRSCLAMGAVGLLAVVFGWTLGRLGAAAPELAKLSIATLALWAAYFALFVAGGLLILRLAARPALEPAADAEPR
ncbi:cytochrome ubiquinol oxidase subunit I [Phenylobacterium sp.]|uniref:cytochrome ubiquinol oxidase subunit I n=1 Tax=Phenylobacterium sp. TaxID=1871053 RepID=UPI0035B0C6CA